MTLDVCTKFNGSLSNSCQDISLKTTNVSLWGQVISKWGFLIKKKKAKFGYVHQIWLQSIS